MEEAQVSLLPVDPHVLAQPPRLPLFLGLRVAGKVVDSARQPRRKVHPLGGVAKIHVDSLSEKNNRSKRLEIRLP